MSRATPMTPDERRQAIVEATLPLLLAKGPDLTTREIARASGVAEGTIFRVFETKDELIKSVIDAAMQPTASLAALAALGPQTLDERVAAILTILAADLHRVRSLFAHLAKVGFPPHPGGPPPKTTKHDPDKDARAQVMVAAARALDPYADALSVPTTTAARLLSAISFATSFGIGNGETTPDPDTMARLVLHGIAKGEK